MAEPIKVDIGKDSEDIRPDFSKLPKVMGESAVVKEQTRKAMDLFGKSEPDIDEHKRETEREPDQERNPDEETKPEPSKEKEEVKAEPEVKKEESQEVAEEKKVEAESAEIPDSDEDIDKFQPKPGSSEKFIKHFNEIKRLWKQDRSRAREAKKEFARIQQERDEISSKVGKLPPEVDSELKELRTIRQRVLLDADPDFQKEFNGKLKTAEDNLFLELRRNGLKEEDEKVMRQYINQYDEQWWQENILSKFTNDILRDRVKSSIIARMNVVDERNRKLQSLASDHDKFLKTQQERQLEDARKWAAVSENRAEEIQRTLAWAQSKEIPKDATKAQRAQIEAHNKRIDDAAEEFTKTILDVYNRDPIVATDVVFKKLHADYLEQELKTMTSERDSLLERIKGLENRIEAKRTAGHISKVESPAPVKKSFKKGAVSIGDGGKEVPADFSTLGRR